MPQKRAIFQDVRLATACSLGGQWTEANIVRWLGRRGGEYTREVDEKTTHLICTVEEYKAKGLKVKQAAKLGVKQCKIVTLDWLEDCLFRDKKLPVKEYTLNAVLKSERAKESEAAKIAKGIELAERFVNTNLYHVYADASNFFYEIELTRDDTEAGWQGQKYILFIFESNAKPHLYHFAAKFFQKSRDSNPKYYRPSETPQTFWTEYDKFKSFFLKKTGIEWDERLVQISLDESLFQYKAPTGGKPVGYVPESGQRKPSTLTVAKKQTEMKADPEPEEKDLKFAAAIERITATQGGDIAEPNLEDAEQQPLINNETLAAGMSVDALEQLEAKDAGFMGEAWKREQMGEGAKDEDAEMTAKQEVAGGDAEIDRGVDVTTPPAQTSPYFATAPETKKDIAGRA